MLSISNIISSRSFSGNFFNFVARSLPYNSHSSSCVSVLFLSTLFSVEKAFDISLPASANSGGSFARRLKTGTFILLIPEPLLVPGAISE